MQDSAATSSSWETRPKRASAIFSVFKWFRGASAGGASAAGEEDSDSASSTESVASVLSTDTAASFSFVPADSYRPFGAASVPEKLLLPGPETATYRARLAQRDARREHDRHLTLRSKYNLHRGPPHQVPEPERRGDSLPLMTRSEAEGAGGAAAAARQSQHRRAASEGGSLLRRHGQHVKGKRKAPQPPGARLDTASLRRKKRMAPQPPPSDVICNDSLKLDRGILKSAKEPAGAVAGGGATPRPSEHVSPRPWYKRTLAKKSAVPQQEVQERRRSGLLFLTNISELDREAVQIMERARNSNKPHQVSPEEPPAFMRPRDQQPAGASDSWLSPRRRSARDLIAKFNAITGVTRHHHHHQQKETARVSPVKEHIVPVVQEEEEAPAAPPEPPAPTVNVTAPKSPVARTAVVKPISRSQWQCPRCTLDNDYWRIICRVCSTIKPYFDDFTAAGGAAVREECPGAPPRSPGEMARATDAWNLLRPQYPRVTPNLDRYFGKAAVAPTKQPSAAETRGHILDEILDEMKKKTEKGDGDGEARLERMILGDELSFKSPPVEEAEKEAPKAQVERMILGDEIKVRRPESSGYEPVEVAKEDAGKVERMILGEEVSVERSREAMRRWDDEVLRGAEEALDKLDQEKRNSAKKEERDKLKKMLIEMKNSLPKRLVTESKEMKQRASVIREQLEDDTPPIDNEILETPQVVEIVELPPDDEANDEAAQPEEKTAELLVVTTETVYENVHVRRTDNPKPLKVSSSAQTNSVVRKTPDFQLIGAKDFIGISGEKTGESGVGHTYANLAGSGASSGPAFLQRSATDTLEINRLLRRLETAIAGGELGQAAVFARELAHLKVPCSVVRHKSEDRQQKAAEGLGEFIDLDMYVEDKVSHRGPFPLKVTSAMTVSELKRHVQDKYKIPADVQRWILGKELAHLDTATLADHHVTTSGSPVFLYLVAPANNNNNNAPEDRPEVAAPAIEEVAQKQPVERKGEAAPEVAEVEEPVPLVEEPPDDEDEDVWRCGACTLLNPLVTQECEVCGSARAGDGDNKTYMQLVDLDNEDLVRNAEGFECLVCLAACEPGQGVTLRECLHQFCRECLAHTVEFSDEPAVKCPYRDEEYACDLALQEREVKALVDAAVYERHLAKSVKLAENMIDNAFHCKTPDCTGWCIFEDNVNHFLCPVCRKSNCLTCQAIHDGMDCRQYQERMRLHSETDVEARRTRLMLDEMVRNGEALACPTCQVVLMKKWGCDWLRCSMCKTEICWVTRGPRWGPAGKGDTSAGCKCGVNGTKCHPKCNYCH